MAAYKPGDGMANSVAAPKKSAQHYWRQDEQLGKQKENLCLLQFTVRVQLYSYTIIKMEIH